MTPGQAAIEAERHDQAIWFLSGQRVHSAQETTRDKQAQKD